MLQKMGLIMMEHRLSLNDSEWGIFEIGKLFEVEKVYGNPIDTYSNGRTPYISTSSINNGVVNFITSDEKSLSKGNCISVDPIGGKAFYHEYDFVGRGFSGASINLLRNSNLNKNNSLFICRAIENTASKKASYGNLFNSNRLKKGKILLPIDDNSNCDWKFMEEYIKQEQNYIVQKVIDYYEKKIIETGFELVGLEDVEWKVFSFDEIFRKIQRGKRLKKADHINGKTPYVSSTSLNNGVDGFIGNEDKVRKFEGNLILANSGSVGSCFYQDYEYIASDHVTSLTLENADKYIYLFMSTIIKRLEDKYSFNREINDKRIRREKIILPIDKFGKPNWDYMSKFMQKIEAEKLDKALEYIYIYI